MILHLPVSSVNLGARKYIPTIHPLCIADRGRCIVNDEMSAIHTCNTPALQYTRAAIHTKTKSTPAIHTKTAARHTYNDLWHCLASMYCSAIFCMSCMYVLQCSFCMYCSAIFCMYCMYILQTFWRCIVVQFFICLASMSCWMCKGVFQCNFLYVLHVYLVDNYKVYCDAIFCMSCKYILLTM